MAVIYFSDSIDIPACRLFGDLDFNSTNFTNSWPNITDTCIQQSFDNIAMLLYHTPSGPGRPLTVAQCQTYVQTMQCRMDCLLTFDLLNPNSKQFAYIHLRAISCNETLFTTSIGNIFSNRNNIQPTFTPRQLAEGKISSCLFFQFSLTYFSLCDSTYVICYHHPNIFNFNYLAASCLLFYRLINRYHCPYN